MLCTHSPGGTVVNSQSQVNAGGDEDLYAHNGQGPLATVEHIGRQLTSAKRVTGIILAPGLPYSS